MLYSDTMISRCGLSVELFEQSRVWLGGGKGWIHKWNRDGGADRHIQIKYPQGPRERGRN